MMQGYRPYKEFEDIKERDVIVTIEYWYLSNLY